MVGWEVRMVDAGKRYDEIGVGYGRYRRPDRRIEGVIRAALGDARRIVNVGAGTGSYEPRDREVVAVEPSIEMIRQRAPGAAPVVQASASELPFGEGEFDVALALLTVHHWGDRAAGWREMRRVARRAVVLTWDPAHEGFWLTRDYFPDILEFDRTIFPWMDEFREAFGDVSISTVPVPRDCVDGFLCAYWARPEAYLDPEARRAISSFSRTERVEERVERLRTDLESGEWQRRNGHLLSRSELDLGYRMIVSKERSPA